LLVVPIVVVAGTALLAIRAGTLLLRRGIGRHTPRGPRTLLAWRRLGREAGAVATLAGAVAVPIALAAYGGTVTDSVRATLRAEARYVVGADVVLTLAERAPVPPELAGRATEVLRVDGTIIGGIQTDVLAVDPATFASAATWDGRLASRSLAAMLGDLRAPAGPDAPVRAFGSSVAPTGVQQVEWRGSPLFTADVSAVGRLPAPRASQPELLVHHDALGKESDRATPQLWVRGDPGEVVRVARAAHLPLARVTVADDIFTDTVFEPVTYTFTYLSALSLLTGLVTTVGLLLYLEGRAPTHRRAYVMLRRMGLARRSHLRALVTEVAVPLVAGLVGGLAIAGGLAAVLLRYFEVNPQVPPDPVLAVPLGTVAAVVVAVAFIAVLGTGYAHRRFSRARPGEVLRDAS
jgi:putative ABC transport system permease protein